MDEIKIPNLFILIWALLAIAISLHFIFKHDLFRQPAAPMSFLQECREN